MIEFIKNVKNTNIINIRESYSHLSKITDTFGKMLVRFEKDQNVFEISTSEGVKLEEEFKINDKIEIKILILYFLMSYKEDYENEFKNDFKEYMDIYFNSDVKNDRNLIFENIRFFIEKIIIYNKIHDKSRLRKDLSKYAESKIVNDKTYNTKFIYFCKIIISYDSSKMFFNQKQIKKIYDNYFSNNNLNLNINYFIILSDYLQYMNLNKSFDKNYYKSYLRLYCDKVINNLDFFDEGNYTFIDFDKLKIYMKQLQCYRIEDFDIIEKKNKEKINFDYGKIKFIEIITDNNVELFSGLNKFVYGFCNSLELNYRFENYLSETLFHIVKIPNKDINDKFIFNAIDILFKEDGSSINVNDLTENDRFCFYIKEPIKKGILTINYVLFNAFSKTLKDSEALKNNVFNILNECNLFNKSRLEYLTSRFLNFFNRDFINSTYDIVLEFENMMRIYFKNKNLIIKKKR